VRTTVRGKSSVEYRQGLDGWDWVSCSSLDHLLLLGAGPLLPILHCGKHGGRSPGSPTPEVPYCVEEDVVKAGGCSVCAPPEGAAPLLQQVLSPKSQQHQEYEEEEGSTNCGWH
jgi:hypothetical protein